MQVGNALPRSVPFSVEMSSLFVSDYQDRPVCQKGTVGIYAHARELKALCYFRVGNKCPDEPVKWRTVCSRAQNLLGSDCDD